MRTRRHHIAGNKVHAALTTAGLLLGGAVLVWATIAHGKPSSVSLQGYNGQDLGILRFEVQSGGTSLDIALKAMSEGWYDVVIHEKGACTGQGDFTDAGMKLSGVAIKRDDTATSANNEKEAGNGTGILADSTGAGEALFFADGATHNRINDQDGSAVIIHSLRPEDTESGRDPMIACGVIAPPQP